MDATDKQHHGHHFVQVHRACHGARCWYKLKALLELEGHRVTVLNLAGSGTNTKTIYNVQSFVKYSKPLLEVMETLEPNEKVILVGHSFDGLSLALVADRFPEKVSVAVFLTAFLPDTVHLPSYVLDQYFAMAPKEALLDTQFAPYGDGNGNPEKTLTSMFFGPKWLSSKLCQSSSPRGNPPRNEFTFVFAFLKCTPAMDDKEYWGGARDGDSRCRSHAYVFEVAETQ